MKQVNEGVKFTPNKFNDLDLNKFRMGIEYEFHTDIPMKKHDDLMLTYHTIGKDKMNATSVEFSDVIKHDGEVLVEIESKEPLLVVIKDATIDKVYQGGNTNSMKDATIDDAYVFTGVTDDNEMSAFIDFIDGLEVPEDDLSTTADYVDDFFGALMEEDIQNVFDIDQYYEHGMGEYIDLLEFKIKPYLEVIAEQIKIFNSGGDVDDHALFMSLYHIKTMDVSLEDAIRKSKLDKQFDFIATLLQKRKLTSYTNKSESSLQELLRKYGVDFHHMEPEGGNQTEVITDVLSVEDGFINIERMLNMLRSEEGVTTSEKSGLHVSISSEDFNHKDLNMIKFYLLMDMGYLGKEFQTREYVNNALGNIRNFIRVSAKNIVKRTKTANQFMAIMTKRLETMKWPDKNVNIAMTDYDVENGRVEIRMYGNEGYEYDQERILSHVKRSLYTLDVCYNEQSHRKEYLQALYKVVNDVVVEMSGKDIQGFIDDTNGNNDSQ